MDRDIVKALESRILILDGAMGTMIQRLNLAEEDFRGDRFRDHAVQLRGCNDLLVLTRPEVIADIHRQYIEAGADIIETDTFNANALSLAEYHLGDYVDEINFEGARIARQTADECAKAQGRKVFVAGSMGPGNIALSMPQSSSAAGEAAVTFDIMSEAYRCQAEALIRGGVDMILLETIFDTLNAKAAVCGVKRAMAALGREVPLMLSVTLTESGRTLSGQTLDAFVASTLQAGALTLGLNCGFGAAGMAPYLESLQKYGRYISLHPNAGLPDEMGRYVETPADMASVMEGYMQRGWLNIAGGCCGTTPDHIRAIAEAASRHTPRALPEGAPDSRDGSMLLAGLEMSEVTPVSGFLKVGERCNVAGSRKFLRLIGEEDFAGAVEIAGGQLAKGAGALDINMDDGMLDAEKEMTRFVELLGLDASTAAAPLMIDSSRREVLLGALKHIQGRPMVNSISLKEGEEIFLENARAIHSLGGAVVVMAFDEEGQAVTLPRRIEICERAYNLLTRRTDIRPCDIIFDPNVLTIATGIKEHDRYALDFLDAVEWIKGHLPGAKVSGGVSNLSFAFRGNTPLREAMHTVFLHHAIQRGMDMAIVNPATSTDISTIDPGLREAIEDVIFMRREDAALHLLDIASAMKSKTVAAKAGTAVAATSDKELSLAEMVVKGVTTHLEERLEEALREDGSALAVIKGRLMEGMNKVGEAFGAGRMFLPQVVRSAGVMKQAIAWLTPYMESESTSADNSSHGGTSGRMIIATVKGDVHDIGKNIVAVVMRCSGFEVVDLGVMVEGERIISEAKRLHADFICLSGLITPSLTEMCNVAAMMEQAGLAEVPLFVGGATTSALHTAVKIAPCFSGLTVHTRDAAALPDIAAALMDDGRRQATIASIRAQQQQLREEYEAKQAAKIQSAGLSRTSVGAASEVRCAPAPSPSFYGLRDYEISISDVRAGINWKAFLHVWRLHAGKNADSGADSSAGSAVGGEAACAAEMERQRLLDDANHLLDTLEARGVTLTARAGLLHACSCGDDILLELDGRKAVIPALRRSSEPRLCMADFVARSAHGDGGNPGYADTLGVFAVTVGPAIGDMIADAERHDDYEAILLQSVADRLVESATDYIHRIIHREVWGLDQYGLCIRPAIGYPSLPDQSLVHELDKIIDYAGIGVRVTENGALWPSATTTGLIFGNPEARYFDLPSLDDDAKSDYARRRGLPLERIRRLLP